MDLSALQPTDVALLLAGVIAGIAVGLPVTLPQVRLPGRAHEHNWQLGSREWTAGKKVEIYVCRQHPNPAIERREVEDLGRSE